MTEPLASASMTVDAGLPARPARATLFVPGRVLLVLLVAFVAALVAGTATSGGWTNAFSRVRRGLTALVVVGSTFRADWFTNHLVATSSGGVERTAYDAIRRTRERRQLLVLTHGLGATALPVELVPRHARTLLAARRRAVPSQSGPGP